MIEVLWHGRGGQGAFTAARLLGAAGSLADGRYGLAFPSFGPERRGAPIRAFTKLDDRPIGDRSALQTADYVVYLDDTLLDDGWEDGLREGSRVLVNTKKGSCFTDPRIIALDANAISASILGREIPNTVFLAAICHLCDGLSAEDAKEAIRQYMAPKLHGANIAIVDRVVAILDGDIPGSDAADDDGMADKAGESVAVATSPQPLDSNRLIPTLREDCVLDSEEFAANTCWDAGFLVSKNSGWRTIMPKIDLANCTGCFRCYMNCPDGAIYKIESAEVRTGIGVAVDYDFCKGCGVCARSCKAQALSMVAERG